jgi:hypothetical protein
LAEAVTLYFHCTSLQFESRHKHPIVGLS